MEKKKKCKIMSGMCAVVGSTAAFVVACIAVSELLPLVSGSIDKMVAKCSNVQKDDDDWGPVIERKRLENEEDIDDADRYR